MQKGLIQIDLVLLLKKQRNVKSEKKLEHMALLHFYVGKSADFLQIGFDMDYRSDHVFKNLNY